MVGVLRMAFAKLEPEAHYISHIESLHPHLKRALRYFFSKRKLLKSLPLINRNIFENSSPATASARAAQLTLSRPRMSTPSNKWRGQENP